MSPSLLIPAILALSVLAYWQGRRRAMAMAARPTAMKMHSRPGYHGMLTAIWCAIPALIIAVLGKRLLLGQDGVTRI